MAETNLNIEWCISVARDYVNDMNYVERCLCKFKVYRQLFVFGYAKMVQQGLTPIEKLPEETKNDIYDTSMKWQPEVVDLVTRVNLCRCIWCMNYILEKYLKI